jgi:hypothetical protein
MNPASDYRDQALCADGLLGHGIVTKIFSRKYLSYQVLWENGQENSYDETDLILLNK